ncbi:RNA polymerase sigma factor SigX [Evansella sp. AB-rgal1]|uniref:RNA polymerase sigma factor SigX n=1 Tax=Evansella sp. AB-rgal1 TaxID=3242696 RepID=UPI00359D8779
MREEFDRLYVTYHHSLFQYLFYMVRNREVAEELVQEVYMKVLTYYGSFRGNSSEKTWMYSIAKHVGIDYIRSNNRQKRKWKGKQYEYGEVAYAIPDQAPLPDELLLHKDELQHVYRSLEKCTIEQQQVILLRYVQSFSIFETASILGWSEAKVKTTQHRAIKMLKQLLVKDASAELVAGT